MPPVRASVDDYGVDLLSGKVIFTTTDLTIGPPDVRGLTYERQWVERGWRPTLVPVLSGSSTNPVVTFDGKSVSFTFTGAVWEPDAKDGSTFSAGSGWATFTGRDGMQVQFVTQDGYTYADHVATWGHPTTVTFPNGAKWKFDYNSAMYQESFVDPDCVKHCTPEISYYYWKRLSSVRSSSGYQLKLSYTSNTLNNGDDAAYWTQISRVTGINNAVETCNPVADSCALTQQWPHADYGYPGMGSDATSLTDPAGQVWTFQYQSTRELTGIVRPNASAPAATYGYTAYNGVGKVTSVTTGGSTWTYAYGVGNTTVTDPASHTRVMTFDPATNLLSADQDENGQATQFAYCQSIDTNCPLQRLKTVTYAGGDSVTYEYDSRGNNTKTTRTPKPGSGLSPLIASASFPASCSNQKTCNQPSSTTNARGAVTDYTYDATHGGILTVTSPAPSTGAPRLEVRYGYTAITGSISGDTVFLRTGISNCRTAVSCVGTADETKAAVGYSTINLQTISQTSSAGDGSLTATTVMDYDNIGNLVAVDGPLAGSADTIRSTYDALRRPVTMVRPDPDGAGPRAHRATRYTYDAQSRAASVAVGTSDSTGASFTALQTTASTYDASDRKIMETVSAGGTTYVLAQNSYNSVGRLDCSVLRTNPATWGSLPDACTPTTAGSAGPDRITRNIYDNAGQLLKVQTAYGTADQSDEVTNTYTVDGQVSSVTDAQNNKTSYEYDGFNRLVVTRYPVTTAGAATSSTSDYEQLGYDGGGNVISRRLRDGQTITYSYDLLNRLTGKATPGSAYLDWDVTYSYDLVGHRIGATGDGWANNAYTYDAFGRVVTEQNYNATTYHTYDIIGRQTRLTWSDGFYVDYDYDAAGQITAIRENGATSGVGVLATYSYDDMGRRTNASFGNGTSSSYSFDGMSRLSSLTQDLGGAGYDFTHSFTYTAAAQIASATQSNDAYAWGGHYNVDRNYTVNGLNQVTVSGSTSLGYDSKGNLSSSGAGSYGYTTENRLVSAPGGIAMAYEPNGGQLLQLYNGATGKDTRFAWSGGLMIAEIDAASWTITKRYVPGPGVDEPIVWYEGAGTSDRRWLHADERGSIVAVTDVSGNVVGVNSYDEYGVPAASNIGRFQYTGQAWLPELGMYYFKARIYSPTLGRFLQTDPIGYSDGLNWYNYVGSDPVNGTDPSGLAMSRPGDIHCIPEPCGRFPDGHVGPINVVTNGDCSKGCWVTDGVTEGGVIKVRWQGPQNPSSSLRSSDIISYAGFLMSRETFNGLLGGLGTVAGGAGIASDTLNKYFGNYSILSPKFREGIKLSATGWRGNQFITSYHIGKIASAVSRYAAGISFGTDVARFANGDLSSKHFGANTAMNGVALFGGPPGWAGAAVYWGVDTFYHSDRGSGIPAAYWDTAGAVDYIVLKM